MTATISKTAKKYYLHSNDTNHDTDEKVVYFSQRPWDESGWGIWIDRNGNVDVDEESANGEKPSAHLIGILRIAARKILAK